MCHHDVTPDTDVRTGRHAVHNLNVHLVFFTEYRRKALTDAALTRTEEIIREVCADFEAELKQFNGPAAPPGIRGRRRPGPARSGRPPRRS
ncbi:transposase [Streptomyces sp. NPDC048142]|uniref:transposase n=1 Tax=Streptomyces sp. NPDC048142 TaxID=3365501 RepID=UPI003721BDF7